MTASSHGLKDSGFATLDSTVLEGERVSSSAVIHGCPLSDILVSFVYPQDRRLASIFLTKVRA